jgi:hypothetical protein
MSDKAPLPLDHAITMGLSEVTRQRTVALYEQQRTAGVDRALNFRGDLAERHQYDKIKPILSPATTAGNVVIIEGVSQKTGETAHYQILGNQWNLLEVLARLD